MDLTEVLQNLISEERREGEKGKGGEGGGGTAGLSQTWKNVC